MCGDFLFVSGTCPRQIQEALPALPRYMPRTLIQLVVVRLSELQFGPRCDLSAEHEQNTKSDVAELRILKKAQGQCSLVNVSGTECLRRAVTDEVIRLVGSARHPALGIPNQWSIALSCRIILRSSTSLALGRGSSTTYPQKPQAYTRGTRYT